MSSAHPNWRFVIVAFAALLPQAAAAESDEATVRSAKQVLDEFTNLQIQQIPAAMLQDVHGVAIFPDVIKIGLVVGGRHGRGVVLVREADGAWRAPTFVSLTGGSIGWQVGAQATDLVLVFKTAKSVEGLLRGKFTLGADAAVAAGPVGRRAEAATDAQLKAEIYSYSRSRGLFAGVSLDGAVMQINDEATRRFYGAAGSPVPESALALMQSVARLTSGKPTAAPNSTLTPTPAGGPALAPPTAAAASSAATVEVLRSDVADAARRLAPLGVHPLSSSLIVTILGFGCRSRWIWVASQS